MSRRVLFPPQSHTALLQGINTISNLLGSTLGPIGPVVAVTPTNAPKARPELLPDAGTIARRMIEFPGTFQNMGALMIRQLACKMQDEVGDGAATAVVIAQATANEAQRYLAAGWNAMQMRSGLEKALQVAQQELDKQARPLDTVESITGMIDAATGDPRLAKVLAEAVDVVGSDGVIMVEESQGTKIDREYQEGIRWDSGYVSIHLATSEDRADATLLDSPILLTDLPISSAQDLLPVLEMVLKSGEKSLVIIAKEVTDSALTLLVANKREGNFNPLAIKAPLFGDNQRAVLEDIAVFTGGRVISDATGGALPVVSMEDLGRARRVWANQRYFSIAGGRGKASAVRERIAMLKALMPQADSEYDRGKLRERMGKLMGGVAVIRIGAPSQSMQTELRQRAEAVIKSLQAAAAEGVVPGGGAAYLGCIPAIHQLALSGAEAAGAQVLARALEEPVRRIVANAGREPQPIIARLLQAPPGWAYDVLADRTADMRQAGIVDALKVSRWALAAGASAGATAMTTDVLVHQKTPPLAKNP
jgi:chaperonin GroEL